MSCYTSDQQVQLFLNCVFRHKYFSVVYMYIFVIGFTCSCIANETHVIILLLLFLQVPRTGGIKKGWVRQYMVVCDFKLFLYEIPPDKNYPSQVVQEVLDMRCVCFAFSVSDDITSTTGVTKAVVCAILSVGWCI